MRAPAAARFIRSPVADPDRAGSLLPDRPWHHLRATPRADDQECHHIVGAGGRACYDEWRPRRARLGTRGGNISRACRSVGCRSAKRQAVVWLGEAPAEEIFATGAGSAMSRGSSRFKQDREFSGLSQKSRVHAAHGTSCSSRRSPRRTNSTGPRPYSEAILRPQAGRGLTSRARAA